MNICKTAGASATASPIAPAYLQAPLRARRQAAAAPARAHPADLPRLRAPPARPPARARRAPARLRRGRTADVKSRCHRCCYCFGGDKRRLCGECRGGARAVWRWCQRTAQRRKRHVRSRVTRGCRLGCSLRVYLDRRARALRFVLRRFGLLLPGRGFFGSVAGLLAAEQTIPRARLLPRAIMAVLALLLLDGCALPPWRSRWRIPFLFKLSEQIVRTANLDSKLKVEVCVRTGPSLCQNRAYAST